MTNKSLHENAKQLRLCYFNANTELVEQDKELHTSYAKIIELEIAEREKRRLENYIRASKVKDFQALTNYDWNWPRSIDRQAVTKLFNFKFVEEKENVVFIGPNGVGKTMLAQNLIHEAAVKGFKAVFVEAAEMLSDLIAQSSRSTLERALLKYTKPQILAIDEVGYLSYDTRHADLLFQIIHRRAKRTSTIITTNKPFGEWREMFPNATSVTALVDRLIEQCVVVPIDADSYRAKRFADRKKAAESAAKKAEQKK